MKKLLKLGMLFVLVIFLLVKIPSVLALIPTESNQRAVYIDTLRLWGFARGDNHIQANIFTDLTNPLPTTGAHGTSIRWEEVTTTGRINLTTGEVSRPAFGDGEVAVTLRATVALGSYSEQRYFNLTIKEQPETPHILPAGYFTAWNPGIPDGIPTEYEVFYVLSAYYGDGIVDAFDAINQAIFEAGNYLDNNPAAPIQVIYLPAGEYFISGPIFLNRSRVVLRGAGMGETIITGNGHNIGIFMGSNWRMWNHGAASWFRVPADYGSTPVANVIGDVATGSRSIIVDNPDLFNSGDVLRLDQIDGSSIVDDESGRTDQWGANWLGLQNDPEQSVWRFGYNFNIRGPYYGTGAGPFSNSGGGPHSPDGFRPVSQNIEIASISGNTLYLVNEINFDFNTRFNPQVWNTQAGDNQFMGVESLTIRGMQHQMIQMASDSSYSWVRDVQTDGSFTFVNAAGVETGWMGTHIEVRGYRNTVRDSFVHDSWNNNPGGTGYGITILLATDSLIENNVAMRLNKPIMGISTGGGNVIAYNFVDIASFVGVGVPPHHATWQEAGIDASHGSFSHSDLYEGNFTPTLTSASTWGNDGKIVFFRNFSTGQNSDGVATDALFAVNIGGWKREHASIGNVLLTEETIENGATGHLVGWGGWDKHSVDPWNIGMHLYDDGFAASFFHSHLDFVTGEGLILNPDNLVVELPDSLYLDGRPAFFDEFRYLIYPATFSWPPVNPLADTHAERVTLLPAQVRYEQELSLLGTDSENDNDITDDDGDNGSGSGSGAGGGSGNNSGSGNGTGGGSGNNAGSGNGTGGGSGNNSGTGSGTGGGSGNNSGSGSGAGGGSGNNAGSGSGTGGGSGNNSGSGSGTAGGSTNNSDTDNKPDGNDKPDYDFTPDAETDAEIGAEAIPESDPEDDIISVPAQPETDYEDNNTLTIGGFTLPQLLLGVFGSGVIIITVVLLVVAVPKMKT